MYLLKFIQDEDETNIGIFDDIEEMRKSLKKLGFYIFKEEDGYIEEYFDISKIPDYVELDYKGKIIPISRFMFRDLEINIDIEMIEIPYLEDGIKGMVDSSTLIDAYMVNNDKVRDYIVNRETNFQNLAEVLLEEGYVIDRYHYGSQDGEAIYYSNLNDDEWHFLIHMDPIFVQNIPKDKKKIKRWLKDKNLL